jgi:hypothetical protein
VGIHCVILLLFLPLRIEMICMACLCLAPLKIYIVY